MRGIIGIDYRSRTLNPELLGTVEIVLALTLGGSSLVIGKLLAMRVPVFLTGALSLGIAFICMLPLQWFKRKELFQLNKKELGLMFLQALCGIVLFRVFTLYGLQRTSAINAGIITSTTPALMALFGIIFLKEKPTLNIYVGIVAAVGGLLLVNLYSMTVDDNTFSLLGNSLIGLAVIGEVFLTIFRKSSSAKISSITNTTVLVFMSTCMFLPFVLLDLQYYSINEMNGGDWGAVFYYGAIATTFAYILWGDGALRIPAATAGIASVAMPISAILLSALVLGEVLTLFQIVGCLLAICGIFACNVKPKKVQGLTNS